MVSKVLSCNALLSFYIRTNNIKKSNMWIIKICFFSLQINYELHPSYSFCPAHGTQHTALQ